jgi:hypothetical protein
MGLRYGRARRFPVYWARGTPNANTYIHYISVDAKFLTNYKKVKSKLKGTLATYAVLSPNLIAKTRYENCVSCSHYLMYQLGLGSWIGTKGWWVPSTSNWADWIKSFVPTWHNGFAWKYLSVPGVNTHIP